MEASLPLLSRITNHFRVKIRSNIPGKIWRREKRKMERSPLIEMPLFAPNGRVSDRRSFRYFSILQPFLDPRLRHERQTGRNIWRRNESLGQEIIPRQAGGFYAETLAEV